MSQETELKLCVHPLDLPRLLAHPLLSAAAPHTGRLHNTYFDTAGLALMRRRMAVRERLTGTQTLLTVKTAGQSSGGLSRRGEWEAPTTPGALDFAALVDDAAMRRELVALAPQLVPVFQTDFVRRRWLLEQGGAQVEVALDEGLITSAARPEAPADPILELELELKSGAVGALFELALALVEGPPDGAGGLRLHPADRSKAERGYALFRGAGPADPEPPQAPAPGLSPLAVFNRQALDALTRLQPPSASGCRDTATASGQARAAVQQLLAAFAAAGPQLPPAFAEHWTARWHALALALEGAPPDAVAQLESPAQAKQVLTFMRDLLALPATPA